MIRSMSDDSYEETGLDYFGARYFSGAQGRFTSPDPITTPKLEDPQRWNKYAYALGNPLQFTDPTGMYNTDCKSNDITKCSAEIQAFEARRKHDLMSDDDIGTPCLSTLTKFPSSPPTTTPSTG